MITLVNILITTIAVLLAMHFTFRVAEWTAVHPQDAVIWAWLAEATFAVFLAVLAIFIILTPFLV